MKAKTSTPAILLLFVLFACTYAQTIVTLPSSVSVGTNQCSNFTITRSNIGAQSLTVTLNYGTGNGLTFNGTSTGTYSAVIPAGATSATVTACSTNSQSSVSSVSASLPNSSYNFANSNSIPVSVSSSSVTIFNGSLVIPRGGCSSAQTVSVTSLPTSSLTVALNQLSGSGYFVRDASSTTTATTFSNASTATSNTFYICSYSNNTLPLTLTPTLSGASANSYTINGGSGSTISLTTGAASTAAVVSLVATTPVNANSTSVLVSITTDTQGILYYQVRDYDDTYSPTDPLSLSYVQSLVNTTNGEYRIHNQSDFLTYLSLGNRDLRVNDTPILPGTTQILVDQPLLPGLNYEICQWFVSFDSTISTTLPCQNLTAPNRTWPVYETAYQFNTSLTREQRNSLLRWLYQNISAPIDSVINLRGESANSSGGNWPSRPWYAYVGDTNDSSNTQTIYVTTNDNGVDSQYVTNLKNLFSSSSSTLNSSVLSMVSNAVGANLVAAQLIGAQPLMTMRNDTSRTLSTYRASYNNSNVTITNISMTNGNGIAYFGVASSSQSVSQENLINCKDSTNQTSLAACGRVTLRSGQNATLVLQNINTSSSFRIYSTATNAYLYRPIVLNASSNNLTGSSISLGNNYVVTYPSSATVSPGACQYLNVSVGTWPYTNVTITGTSNNSNVTVSNGVVIVNGQNTNPTVEVCVVSGASLGTAQITWTANGTNSADYQSSTTTVSIVNAVGDISVPAAVSVPQGGCSSSFNINSSSLAAQDVFIFANNANSFYFPNSSDGNYLHFNQSSSSTTFTSQICSYSSANSSNINMTIGGVNSNVFTVNGANQTTMTATLTSAPTPSVYFQANPIYYNDGTNVTIAVVTNRQGWVYYSLTEGWQNVSIFTLKYIKNNFDSGNYYVWNQSNFNSYIYTNGRDARLNRTLAYAGVNNWVSHTGLQPATIYTICGYYSSDDNSVTSTTANCSQFITNSAYWPVYRAVLNFSQQLTSTQRNRMLCYLVNAIQPLYNRYLVNLRSQSCNTSTINSTVAYEWYNYSGTIVSVDGVEVIYLLTQDNGTQSQATTNFLNMFDPNTNRTVSSVSSGLSSATGVTLTSGNYDGSTSTIAMKTSNRTTRIGSATGSGSNVNINNVVISGGHGDVYFGFTNTTNYPSVEQLLNCYDGNNTRFVNCTKLSLARGQNASLTFSSVGSPKYVYYVTTNDYPCRPINTTWNVSSMTIQRVTFGERLVTLLVLVMLTILLAA